MRVMLERIVLILVTLTFFNPPSLLAATEQRLALVIGNGSYSSSPLKNPVNDATDMTAMLQTLGFDVILKTNVSHRSMEEAIRDFGTRLKSQKGVGLFFYAGHGMQVNNTNYLIPVGARIEKAMDVQFEAVNVERILAEMANADNGLNIVMLDACRDNPFRSLFRSAHRGLAVVSNAPTGTLISYSTAANRVARDGSGRNSPYTAALLKHMGEPGLSINDVFMKVRQNVRRSTGQTPWELSSLEGNFYFNQGQPAERVEVKTEPAREDTVREPASADIENEMRKIAAEREKLRRDKELFEQRKALAEERRKLEEEQVQHRAEQSTLPPSAGSEIDDAILKEKEMRLKELTKEIQYTRSSNVPKALLQELESLYSKEKAEYDRLVLATGKRPSAGNTKERKSNERFVAYDNGTVLDTQTNLMWASRDNGIKQPKSAFKVMMSSGDKTSKEYHSNARSFCENYRGGGYTDWRMPTLNELRWLYDRNKSNHVATDLINISSIWIWASETQDARCYGAFFNMKYGSASHFCPGDMIIPSALPVRSVK